ncbi:MAG: MFS transporter [Bacteroidetes bacterium]|nr:MFS transporter [Bacteroidota bacterium]
MKLNNRKLVNAWIFYDWANSVFPLVITAAIFPPFYEEVTKQADGSDLVYFWGLIIKNSVLYSYSFSFSFLITAFLSPLLSGIADYSGNKKTYMRFFVLLGSLSCIILFFFDGSNIPLGLLGIILGNIGFNGSLVFYNAYLKEIVTEDELDKVSAKGYSVGYFGGFILLVMNLALIMNADKLGIESKVLPYQLSFLSVGIWWFLFSQYTFYHLPKNKGNSHEKGNYILNGFREINKVFKQLKHQAVIRKFLVGFFFYSMGVQTVLYMASFFGAKVLNVSTQGLIISILLIQLVAMLGAQLFARLSLKFGNIKALLIALAFWVITCVTAYFIYKPEGFYLLAAMVGLVMGGIQSLSRSTYSKLIPKQTTDTASYFSFYEFSEKIAIVLGIAAYGLIEDISGSMRNSILMLILFFVAGFIALSFVKIKKA